MGAAFGQKRTVTNERGPTCSCSRPGSRPLREHVVDDSLGVERQCPSSGGRPRQARRAPDRGRR